MSCGLALHNDEMYNQQPYILKNIWGSSTIENRDVK